MVGSCGTASLPERRLRRAPSRPSSPSRGSSSGGSQRKNASADSAHVVSFRVCRGVRDWPERRCLSIANVPPTFACMDTLDRSIRDLNPARPKRSGLSRRRFGVLGDSGFAASLMRALTSPDARGEPTRGYGSWLMRGSLCLPMFPFCKWTNSPTANSSIPGPSRCRSNAPRLSRAEDGTGMGKTRNGCVITEQAATQWVLSPRTLECCQVGAAGQPMSPVAIARTTCGATSTTSSRRTSALPPPTRRTIAAATGTKSKGGKKIIRCMEGP